MHSAAAISEAMALAGAGRLEEAERLLRGALARAPSDPALNRALAGVLMDTGRPREAAGCLRRVAESSSLSPQAWYELGMAEAGAGRYAPAAEALERAVSLAPGAAVAHDLLGQVCLKLQQPGRALRAASRGLQIDSGNVGMAHTCVMAYKGLGMSDEAAGLAGQLADAVPGDMDLQMLAAWQATYAGSGDPSRVRGFLERRGSLLPGADEWRFANDRDPERRVRVGFLCQDIRKDSPIARFIAGPVLHLNRGAFEVVGYCTEPTVAAMTPRLLGAVPGGWVDVSGLDDAGLVARVRGDGVDILVETAGNTMGHRQAALARRMAPVQVSCIGDPRTTGNPSVDYRMVDLVTDPGGSEGYCTERLARVPGCFLCYEAHEDSPPGRPPRAGGPVTFGSFNVMDKTGPGVVAAWARILRDVEGSRIILKSLSYRPPEVRDRYLALFKSQGVDPSRVSIVAEESGMAEHLARYHGVDIALDTFPYNGTTTTCDALWMGVPVVTFRGAWHVARVGASLLAAAGLPELVAEDVDGYVRAAVTLARDAGRVAGLHRTLRERVGASALMDGPGYAARLGAVYRDLWRAWCSGGRA